jgi:hypothetical protein
LLGKDSNVERNNNYVCRLHHKCVTHVGCITMYTEKVGIHHRWRETNNAAHVIDMECFTSKLSCIIGSCLLAFYLKFSSISWCGYTLR